MATGGGPQRPSYTKAYVSGVAFGEKSAPDYTWDGVFVENKKLETKYLPNDLMNQLKELSSEVSSMWDSINSTRSTADTAQTAGETAQSTANNALSMIANIEERFAKIQSIYSGQFDGKTENRDNFILTEGSVINYYKISDFSPLYEDIVRFTGQTSGLNSSGWRSGKNCSLCGSYGEFIIVNKAGECTVFMAQKDYTFTAPSPGLYARKDSNGTIIADTYNFTYYQYNPVIINPSSWKKYYLTVNDSGVLTTTEITT